MGLRIPTPDECIEITPAANGGPNVQTDVRDKTEIWLVARRVPAVGVDGHEVVDIEGHKIGWWDILAACVAMGVEGGEGYLSAEDVALTMAFAVNDESIFIGPIPINSLFPLARCEWPGCYYPVLERNQR